MTENISFDKDSLIALIENFIINLDELATFTRVEINALKSILSKSFITKSAKKIIQAGKLHWIDKHDGIFKRPDRECQMDSF